MKVSPPNYTQTPNDLFDEWLPHLSEIELKVLLVIMRQTFGWHRKKQKISLSEFQKITGLDRKSVSKGVNLLIEKGLVAKEINGTLGTEETYYELVIDDGGGRGNIPLGGRGNIPLGVGEFVPPPTSDDIHIGKKGLKKDDDDAGARGRASDFCRDDIHFACVKMRKDWIPMEIDKAWNSYLKYSGNITDPLKYIEAIIEKNRLITENQKEKSCPKKPSKSDSKSSLPINKKESLEKDIAAPAYPKYSLAAALKRIESPNGSKEEKIF